MQSCELKDTDQNIYETFLKDDIGRNEDLFYFCRLLNSIKGCFTIGLNGKWGSGKTFFIKQAKMILDAYNTNIPNFSHRAEIQQKVKTYFNKKDEKLEFQSQITVYYDAWKNDLDSDPILSLIYSILRDFKGFKYGRNYKLKRERNLADILGKIVDLLTDHSISSLLKNIRGKNLLEKIQEEKTIDQLIEDFFSNLLPSSEKRIVLFIDELDRCKPSYAIQLLEKIEHYFINKNLTVVFSVNILELQHTIKRYYGEGFCASRYLNRFFDINISLPPANLSIYEAPMEQNSDLYSKMCIMVNNMFHFELRDVSKFFYMAHVAYTNTIILDTDFSILYVLNYIVPLLIGLKLYDEDSYVKFISGEDSSWLTKIYDKGGSSFFKMEMLLNSNESYTTEEGKIQLDSKGKMHQLYDALFVKRYEGNQECSVGKLCFNSIIQKKILQVENLLSDHANYEEN